MLFDFNFCITYMYTHNCVHIMFKIWYITIILSYFLLCAVHLMQGFVYEKMLQGIYCRITLRTEVSSQEMKKTLH
jgi:hypothetical protein